MKVVDLAKAREERRPHVSGHAHCMSCRHEWEGVWPAGNVELECPECGSMRGRSKFDVAPAEGSLVWECVHCQNQFFHCLQDRVHCPGCGTQWSYADMVG